MSNDEIFADLGSPGRVWAVASIHGQVEQLRMLHMELAERLAPGDRLVYLGNYLGIGAGIVATLDELIAFRSEALCVPGMEPWDIVYLRGAQEEMWRKMLQLQFATAPGEVFEWMMQQGAGATLAAYGGSPERARGAFREGPLATTRWTGALRGAQRGHPGHDELMTSLRRAAHTADGLLFVHAGVDPQRPLSEQQDTFWWGSAYLDGMSARYDRFRLVIRGFDRRHGPPRITESVASLDGGCGFGGPLVAACFAPDGRTVDWIEV